MQWRMEIMRIIITMVYVGTVLQAKQKLALEIMNLLQRGAGLVRVREMQKEPVLVIRMPAQDVKQTPNILVPVEYIQPQTRGPLQMNVLEPAIIPAIITHFTGVNVWVLGITLAVEIRLIHL